MARVIGVVSGKGGVGKTTVVTNIGASLAKHFNKRVTIVDCNITTSHLGISLGMYYWPMNLNKVLKGEVTLKESLFEHSSGMRILPASLRYGDAEGVDMMSVKKLVKDLSPENDVVLLDAGPGLGRESLITMSTANELLFVTTPHVPAVIDIVRSLEVVKKNKSKVLGIVLNNTEGHDHELSRKEVEQITGVPVIAEIPRDHSVGKSLSAEQPVVTFDPLSPASEEFLALSAGLAGEEYKRPTGFARLLRRLGFGGDGAFG